MANQLIELLRQWHPQRDELDWVLGTVYKTEGPSYRKAGAMMFFNSLGQQMGLLSGGCLESDLQKHARRAMQHGQAVTLCYDATDEDDISFQLGIGCGGVVYILLQPVNKANQYLGLTKMYAALKARQQGYYHQMIPTDKGEPKARFEIAGQTAFRISQGFAPEITAKHDDEYPSQWLISPIMPSPHLLVIGGGIDARPVINIAAEMGWETTLWDSRPANARREHFMNADMILDASVDALGDYVGKQRVDAAILMTHNVQMDARALQHLHRTRLQYLALLGPVSRRRKVLRAAKLTESTLQMPVHGPAGLDIGGELPESIALSMLAECHVCLQKQAAEKQSAGVAA